MLTARLIDSIASENLQEAVGCLEEGGDPNKVSNEGATAMHIAAGIGVESVRLMLAYGGDPNVRSVDGSTPLHVAAAWGDKDTLKLLLHNGADPNLVDQDGQRAVDVARCEDHAACADFLKYYTMLVTVGDEEECPMYTSKQVNEGGTSSAVPSRSTKNQSISDYHQHSKLVASYSSDEEDPDHLSSQYTDALSRRLSRLLTDGSQACLDVTSPDCPYITDKHAQRYRDCDKTILADHDSADSSDSDNSGDDDLLGTKSGCRCRSSHCCAHGEADVHSISRTKRTRKCSEQYLDKPVSPKYCSMESSYTRNVEKRMKQKYFPELQDPEKITDRGRAIEQDSRCWRHLPRVWKQSHYRSLSPQQARGVACTSCFQARSASPCVQSPVHHFEPLFSHELSQYPHKVSSAQSSCPYCVHHSPFEVDHRHSPHRSPQRGQHLPRDRQRGSWTPTDRCQAHLHHKSCHHSPCSPSVHRSSSSHGRGPPPLCMSSTDDCHVEKTCGREACPPSPTNTLRRQATYPQPGTGNLPTSKPRSPLTIMSVQRGSHCPLPGVYDHYGISYPFTDSSPSEHTGMGLDVHEDGRTETVVTGSRSSQSVDSGFCERHIVKKQNQKLGTSISTQCQGTDVPRSPPGLRNPYRVRGLAKSASADENFTPMARFQSKKERELKDTTQTPVESKQVKDVNQVKYPHADRHIYGAGSHHLTLSKTSSPLENSDTFTIVSSNLTKGHTQKPELSPEAFEGHERTHKEEIKQAAKDLSISSVDSFETCEEAPEAEGDYRRAVENMNKQNILKPSSESQTKHHAEGEKAAQLGIVRKVPMRSHEQGKCSPSVSKQRDTGEHIKRESLGFVVSDLDESYVSPSNLNARYDLELTRSSGPLGRNKGEQSNKVPPLSKHMEKFATTDPADFQLKHSSQSKRFPAKNVLSQKASQPSSLLKPKHSLALSGGQQRCKNRWKPPAASALDDSDVFTSDGSFMARSDGRQTTKSGSLALSDTVSQWLESTRYSTQGSEPKDVRGNKLPKRVSDESMLSVASSVQEYIYRDKENGITLIERYIPSDYSCDSSQASLETADTLDTEETVSYDWSDFVIDDDHINGSSSSSSSFDVTAGQTMQSQETLKDSVGCNEDCLDQKEDKKGDAKNGDHQKDRKKCSKEKKGTSMKRKPANNRSPDTNSQPARGSSSTDQTANSTEIAISPDLASLSNEAIHQSLKELGEDPGPVTPSTRQTYLLRLASLHSGECRLAVSAAQPGYSSELNRLLSGSLDMEELAKSEQAMVAQFQTSNGRAWREGTIKSCFNYLLLDPRVTDNLPLRAKALNDSDAFKTFLSAIFYIGKGKRSRPYCHLYEAISQLKSPKPKVSQKVQHILDIWSSGQGVVSLHCFQNVIPVEAYTREACMVDAVGLGRLTNMKRGDYYGVASTWPSTKRRGVGAYLLRKAFQIFLSEGERQICPLDIQRGK